MLRFPRKVAIHKYLLRSADSFAAETDSHAHTRYKTQRPLMLSVIVLKSAYTKQSYHGAKRAKSSFGLGVFISQIAL